MLQIRNSGLNVAELMADAYARHACDDGATVGIDVVQGVVRDVVGVEPQVVAPARLPLSVMRLACNVALQILGIDENVLMLPRESFSVD